MSASHKPDGHNCVPPYLIVSEAKGTIEFLKWVFHATELRMFPGANGGLVHAEARVVSRERDRWRAQTRAGPLTVRLAPGSVPSLGSNPSLRPTVRDWVLVERASFEGGDACDPAAPRTGEAARAPARGSRSSPPMWT